MFRSSSCTHWHSLGYPWVKMTRLSRCLSDHRKLTWNDLVPLSITGNGPAKPCVTDHFLCSFPNWGILLSSMTTGTSKHKPRVYTIDCWEHRQKCFFRLFWYGQPSANGGSSPEGKRTTSNRFCQRAGDRRRWLVFLIFLKMHIFEDCRCIIHNTIDFFFSLRHRIIILSLGHLHFTSSTHILCYRTTATVTTKLVDLKLCYYLNYIFIVVQHSDPRNSNE